MKALLADSLFFGCFITIFFMWIGSWIVRKLKISWFPPIIIDLCFVISVLKVLDISYDEYYQSAQYIGWLLTPATVSLAIPLYRQRQQLRMLWREIISGVLVGSVFCVTLVWLFALVFHMSKAQYVTLLPKSVTAAISMALSEELGGVASITVVSTTLTGALGNIFAEPICKWLHITEPVAAGVAIGSSSHALGTARAIEMGETEGAISSLSMVLAGLVSVVIVPIFAHLVV